MAIKRRLDRVEQALHEGDEKFEIWVIRPGDDEGAHNCIHRRKGCPPKPCRQLENCWYVLADPDMIIIRPGESE